MSIRSDHIQVTNLQVVEAKVTSPAFKDKYTSRLNITIHNLPVIVTVAPEAASIVTVPERNSAQISLLEWHSRNRRKCLLPPGTVNAAITTSEQSLKSEALETLFTVQVALLAVPVREGTATAVPASANTYNKVAVEIMTSTERLA